MDDKRKTYRSEFDDASKALAYDDNQYAPNSWSALLWELEREVLRDLLSQQTFVPNRGRYLDFACGTGRVIGHIASVFEVAIGLDISPAMVARAETRVPEASFMAGDFVSDPELAGGDFDLITSFRFLLNADHSDREAALRWFRSKLRDADSRLVVNNHGNYWTHKAIAHSVRRLTGRGNTITGNVLSDRYLRSLFQDAGFEVVGQAGMGVLGGRSLRMTSFETASALQWRAMRSQFLSRVGENQIYVLAPC